MVVAVKNGIAGDEMTGFRPLPKKPKHNLLQGIFFVLLISLAAYVFLQSPLFDVQKIEISGRNRISKEQLIKLSGVVSGSNIFKLDLRTGEDKIKLLPTVKTVKIVRKFPSTVVINIQEREPIALLPLGKDFIEIDVDGVYLREGSVYEASLPIITGCEVNEPKLGYKISGEGVDTVLKTLSALPNELVHQLSEIHLENYNKIFIYTLNGVQGRLGSSEEIEQKGKVFLQVLSQVSEGKPIEYIDLTSFKSPVVKYRSPEV